MVDLKDLLEKDERIVNYHITIDGWYSRSAIITKGSDIASALEDTLHRILEVGGTEDDVYRIMGAVIPTEEKLREIVSCNEFIWIDLGYAIPGLIDYWQENEEVS